MLTIIGAISLGLRGDADDNHKDPTLANAVDKAGKGRQIFRFDTFGDQAFWGDTLKLHQAMATGKIGTPAAPVFLPTPNHSHIVDNSRVNTRPIWWEVRPVLVMNQADWPSPDGSSGITSSKIMDDVEAAGRAVEVGSNFFLFFSSGMGSSMNGMHDMPGMQH